MRYKTYWNWLTWTWVCIIFDQFSWSTIDNFVLVWITIHCTPKKLRFDTSVLNLPESLHICSTDTTPRRWISKFLVNQPIIIMQLFHASWIATTQFPIIFWTHWYALIVFEDLGVDFITYSQSRSTCWSYSWITFIRCFYTLL